MPQAQDTGQKTATPEVKLPSLLEENRMLDVKQFAAAIGFSVAHTRRLYREGKLPAPIKLNGRKCGWTVATTRKLVEAA